MINCLFEILSLFLAKSILCHKPPNIFFNSKINKESKMLYSRQLNWRHHRSRHDDIRIEPDLLLLYSLFFCNFDNSFLAVLCLNCSYQLSILKFKDLKIKVSFIRDSLQFKLQDKVVLKFQHYFIYYLYGVCINQIYAHKSQWHSKLSKVKAAKFACLCILVLENAL